MSDRIRSLDSNVAPSFTRQAPRRRRSRMRSSSCEIETRPSVFTSLSDRNPLSHELTPAFCMKPIQLFSVETWQRALISDGTSVLQAPIEYTGTRLSKKRVEGVLSGQLAVGTCEIVMLNRDSSVPRRTIARQTARCACRRGQIAGTTRARPACVDARIVRSRQWCEMAPCLEGEVCSLLFNRSGWTCTRGSGRIKTVTVIHKT
ncbi:hypothetical protein ABVT39_006339 [Epinephelus coioides]